VVRQGVVFYLLHPPPFPCRARLPNLLSLIQRWARFPRPNKPLWRPRYNPSFSTLIQLSVGNPSQFLLITFRNRASYGMFFPPRSHNMSPLAGATLFCLFDRVQFFHISGSSSSPFLESGHLPTTKLHAYLIPKRLSF